MHPEGGSHRRQHLGQDNDTSLAFQCSSAQDSRDGLQRSQQHLHEDTAGQEVRSAVPCGGRCRLSLPQVNKVAVVETVAGLKLVFDQKQDQKQHGKNCPRPDTVFI